MQTVIGNKVASSVTPQAKPFEIRDTRLKGFILRVQPSGTKTYIVEYARGKRITIGSVDIFTATEARERAREILAQAVQGADPVAERRAAQTRSFGSYLDQHYGPWFSANRKTGHRNIARLKIQFHEFANFKLADITPLDVERWRTNRLKTVAKTTVNRELASFKAAISKAHDWGLIKENPLRKVKPSQTDNSNVIRYLTTDEENRLRNALKIRGTRLMQGRQRANEWRTDRKYEILPNIENWIVADHLAPMVLLTLNTGLRRGELFALAWNDINFEQANLTVHGDNAKSGKTRHIPLNKEALDALRQWSTVTTNSGLVFASRDGTKLDTIKTAWATLTRAANITEFRWHDLRHHFASRLVMAGVDLNTVRELLGHADIKMTLRYAHLAPEHKARAVAMLVDGNNGISGNG